MNLDPEKFKIICQECGGDKVEIRAYASGGCPSCGPETKIEVTCLNKECKSEIYKMEYVW